MASEDMQNDALNAAVALDAFFNSTPYHLHKAVQQSFGSSSTPEQIMKAQMMSQQLEQERVTLGKQLLTRAKPGCEIIVGTSPSIKLVKNGKKSAKALIKLFSKEISNGKLKPYSSCTFKAMGDTNIPEQYGYTIHIPWETCRPQSPVPFGSK